LRRRWTDRSQRAPAARRSAASPSASCVPPTADQPEPERREQQPREGRRPASFLGGARAAVGPAVIDAALGPPGLAGLALVGRLALVVAVVPRVAGRVPLARVAVAVPGVPGVPVPRVAVARIAVAVTRWFIRVERLDHVGGQHEVVEPDPIAEARA